MDVGPEHMRQRLWTTVVAFAAPTMSLLLGTMLTFGAVQLAAEASDNAIREELDLRLRRVAAAVATRLDAGIAGDTSALLTGLDAGPDTALAVRDDQGVIADNSGAAQLGILADAAVPGHPGVAVIVLGPSSYFAAALPVVVAAVGISTTALLSIGVGVWSLQSRRRKAVEQDLAHTYRAARHDALTGLVNRPHLMEWLDEQLERCKESGRSLGLVFIDVDRFKTVNDTMGHAVGDELLKEVARRLGASVRGGDLVARLAGDEFVVVFPGVADAETLVELAERMQAAFDPPVELRTGPFYAGLSMGLAVGDAHTASSLALLEQADAAMYVAKGTPGIRHAFFDERLRAEADSRQALGDALRAGLDAGELVLHYQPVVEVNSGEVVAVEAFIRWIRPGHGIVSPGSFLPVAEDTGLIGAIGRMVVLEACIQAASWNGDTSVVPPLPVAVNVSERQLLAPDFVQVVARAVETSRLPACLLQIEINESTAADKRVRSSGVLEQLTELGVALVVDDFGLRHGSLGLLKELPLAAVKIHGSSVMDVADSERDQAVVEAVVNLAGVLGALVVAECVETPEQLAMLRRLGVRYVQGHLFLPPAPGNELDGLRHSRRLELRHSTGMVLSANVARSEA